MGETSSQIVAALSGHVGSSIMAQTARRRLGEAELKSSGRFLGFQEVSLKVS